MSVQFTEGRGFPSQLRNGMGHYRGLGDGPTFTEQGAVEFVKAISPWELLKGLFVDKPRADQAAQVAMAQTQAQLLGADSAARQKTVRTAVLVGSGLAGLMLIALVLKKSSNRPVAGYRRRSRRARRNR